VLDARRLVLAQGVARRSVQFDCGDVLKAGLSRREREPARADAEFNGLQPGGGDKICLLFNDQVRLPQWSTSYGIRDNGFKPSLADSMRPSGTSGTIPSD
jgi:hypothetical protein